MTANTITEAQARAIFADENADNYPYRVISESGKAHLAQWVKDVAAEPDRHDLGAWQTEAEQRDAGIDEDVHVEMRAHMTRTGNPEILSFDANHFDWVISA